MSAILYYSNFCEKCKTLLQRIARSSKRDDLHYVCIDKRQQGGDGSIHVILENGQTLLLPSSIVKVPALLQLNNNNNVLFGNEIIIFKLLKEINSIFVTKGTQIPYTGFVKEF